jgi:acyl CoA:acetate/3-ketoacid CoA transferase beta subunit
MLGPKRTILLKEKAKPDFMEKEFGYLLSENSGDRIANEVEIMILAAAWQIMKRVLKGQHKILLGGVGVSMLSSWIAFYLLRKAGYYLDLVVGSGPYGFEPRVGDPFYGTFNNLHTCKALFDSTTIYGYFIAGSNSRSLSVLGAGQIDKYGNINSTKTDIGYLMGSGGANDAANASDVFVVAKQSRHKFVDNVSYITSPGQNVTTIISNMGVFEKPENTHEFVLIGCLPSLKEKGMRNKIKRIKEECGWNLKVANDVKEYGMPTSEELSLLRAFDPGFVILGG